MLGTPPVETGALAKRPPSVIGPLSVPNPPRRRSTMRATARLRLAMQPYESEQQEPAPATLENTDFAGVVRIAPLQLQCLQTIAEALVLRGSQAAPRHISAVRAVPNRADDARGNPVGRGGHELRRTPLPLSILTGHRVPSIVSTEMLEVVVSEARASKG